MFTISALYLNILCYYLYSELAYSSLHFLKIFIARWECLFTYEVSKFILFIQLFTDHISRMDGLNATSISIQSQTEAVDMHHKNIKN